MAANLTKWGGEPSQGASRAAMRARRDDVEWHAVTTLEDGSAEWKSSDPAKEVSREAVAHRKYIQKWLRNNPDALRRQWVVEPERTRAEERERESEKEEAREKAREAHNREEIAVRRLMGTTVKRLGKAINQVVAGEKELVKYEMRPAATGKRPRRKKAVVMQERKMRARMVTPRELKAAFTEFLVDSGSDKSMTTPREYRQWLWTDRNTVYLAPAGRRKRGGQGRVAG